MNHKILKKCLIALILFFAIGTGFGSAQGEYQDTFDNLNNWLYDSNTWSNVNGSGMSLVTEHPMIFKNYEGENYILEIDVRANNDKYAEVQFYFFYKDPDNYGRVYFADDNRGSNLDRFGLHNKGVEFTNIINNIEFIDNKSLELNTAWNHIKIVRLNRMIYVYLNEKLLLKTQFKDENPSGKVGFDVYASTGYFDNFYLRPIEMKNASGYIDKLNLTNSNPTTYLGPYTLRLEGVEKDGNAMFSLSKFGEKVDTTLAVEGTTATLNYENGDAGVEFKLVKAFSGGSGGIVQLEDIISASSDSVNVGVTNLTLLPSYYQGENIRVNFSITNPLNISYNGNPIITINSEGSTVTMSPELALGAGQSKDFSAVMVAPKTTGAHKLTIILKFDEYTTVTKTQDYQVRALNSVVTTLSPDLREDNGIRGSVTLGSAFSDELADWNMTAKVEVFRVLENGKQRVYSAQIPVRSNKFDIAIAYPDFYSDDGRYLVTLKAGEMMSDKFFEIKGPDGEYKPVKGEMIPQTIVSNALYPQLMMLLIGMVASLSVRNYMHPRNWSLPIDLVVVCCGVFVFATGMIQKNTEIIIKGMIIAGVGFMLVMAREHNPKVDSLFLRGSPIHDFIGLLLIFFSGSYIMMLVPEWNLILIVGTLVVYYTVINLHGERAK